MVPGDASTGDVCNGSGRIGAELTAWIQSQHCTNPTGMVHRKSRAVMLSCYVIFVSWWCKSFGLLFLDDELPTIMATHDCMRLTGHAPSRKPQDSGRDGGFAT
ncbi:hypothetical protein F5Y15DRAFT_412623 [Xylariaceae sp. FL0016]|nr:hypothetical protein F5Y15DRAFT_412623 [Xylariaceae sp. FL0016]